MEAVESNHPDHLVDQIEAKPVKLIEATNPEPVDVNEANNSSPVEVDIVVNEVNDPTSVDLSEAGLHEQIDTSEADSPPVNASGNVAVGADEAIHLELLDTNEAHSPDLIDVNSIDDPGPLDCSVLYDQDNHISSAIWEGKERGVLRCHEHTTKLDEWKLTKRQVALVEKAGFKYFRMVPSISLDKALIAALIERWRSETNTFHLSVGEMTITLQDVALLLGLAIDGEAVIGEIGHSRLICERLLGKAPQDLDHKGMVKLSWLKEVFCQCPEDAPFEVIERHTRAYLLYLVGSTIFATTSGNKVPLKYLPLFEDFEKAGKYAWGAATLAYLYKAMGKASLRSQKSTTSGSLTLLQTWSYYHLNIGRPKHNQIPNCFPFVLQWKGKPNFPREKNDVVSYRKALDTLQPCDVEWLPYSGMEESSLIPKDIKRSLMLGTSKTMLICFEKAERHLPDRCLRQFGRPQAIPEDVLHWERKIPVEKEFSNGRKNIDLSGKMKTLLKEWLNRYEHIVKDVDGVDESNYMQWYLSITRKFVGRPTSLPSEYQNKIAAMREIASIADKICMLGMDKQDQIYLEQIQEIAHKSLINQIEGSQQKLRKTTGKRKRKDIS